MTSLRTEKHIIAHSIVTGTVAAAVKNCSRRMTIGGHSPYMEALSPRSTSISLSPSAASAGVSTVPVETNGNRSPGSTPQFSLSAAGPHGGLALASAIAGILGLPFPSTAVLPSIHTSYSTTNSTSNTNGGINANSISTNNKTTTSVSIPVTSEFHESNNSNVSPISHSGTDASMVTMTTETNILPFAFSFAPQQQTCSDVSSETGSAQSPFTMSTAMAPNISGSGNDVTTTYNQKMPADSCDYDPYGSYLSASDRDRKQREFIPDSKKDDKYWERRRKNNEAAKRSREKRRQNDILMEHRINLLNAQNNKLRQQLVELKMRFGLPLDDTDQTVGLDGVLLSPLSNGTQQQSSLMSGLTMTTEPRLRHSYKHITSDSLSQTSEVRQNMKRRASFEEDPKIPLSNGPHCDSNNSPANRPNGDGPQNQHSATLPTTSPNSNNVSTCSPPNGDSLPPKASQPLLPNLPQLGILDSTDLLTLKRIFSTLAMGANNLESLPPSSGGQTPSSPLLLDGIPTTSTVSSTLDPATAATAAWLFRQTMLLPTTHPLNIPSSGENHASATNGSHMEPSFLSNTLGSTSPLLQLTVVNSPQQPSTRTAESVETPLDLSLCMTAMNSDHQSNSGGLSSSSESKLLDKRYQDRRRRNNEAVRRCRENKRARMMGRAEVTDRLQTENRVLRTELTGLSLEVKALRKLLSTDKQQSPISKGSPAQSLSPLILKRSTSDSEASGDVQMNDRRDKQESGPLSVGDSAITTSVKEETGTEQREVRSEEVLTAISGHNGENDSVEVMDEESSTKSEESLMTADAPESLGSLNGLGNDIHSSELKLSDSRVTNGKCSRSSPHHAPRIQPQFSRGRRRLSKLTSGGRRGISSSDVSSVNGTNWLDDRCQATEFAQSIVRVHEFSTVRKSEDFIAS